jgi:hypothetical protein
MPFRSLVLFLLLSCSLALCCSAGRLLLYLCSAARCAALATLITMLFSFDGCVPVLLAILLCRSLASSFVLLLVMFAIMLFLLSCLLPYSLCLQCCPVVALVRGVFVLFARCVAPCYVVPAAQWLCS